LLSLEFTSAPEELSKFFEEGDEAFDYAVFDLGDGRKWLTSRLFVFATMLERMRGIRCCVFLESSGVVEKRFVATASPNAVRLGARSTISLAGVSVRAGLR
jgi:hypothetical protein